jgi:hypothetical protein
MSPINRHTIKTLYRGAQYSTYPNHYLIVSFSKYTLHTCNVCFPLNDHWIDHCALV